MNDGIDDMPKLKENDMVESMHLKHETDALYHAIGKRMVQVYELLRIASESREKEGQHS